jgi:hypothetical protein
MNDCANNINYLDKIAVAKSFANPFAQSFITKHESLKTQISHRRNTILKKDVLEV